MFNAGLGLKAAHLKALFDHKWLLMTGLVANVLMYGLGMNNNGTGLVLASLVLAAYPRVMVPIIFYNLVQHVVAGSIHIALDRKRRAQEDG